MQIQILWSTVIKITLGCSMLESFLFETKPFILTHQNDFVVKAAVHQTNSEENWRRQITPAAASLSHTWTAINRAATGVNFTNMFTRSFYEHRSQKRRIQSNHQWLFALLRSVSKKAACKMLVKLTPVGREEGCGWNKRSQQISLNKSNHSLVRSLTRELLATLKSLVHWSQ